jgi:hypothetical protein
MAKKKGKTDRKPSTHLTMTRISPAKWASFPEPDMDDPGAEEAYRAFHKDYDAALRLVQEEVEKYVNDDDLTGATEEDREFPARSQMTGEYYLGYEMYEAREFNGRGCYCYVVQACCLEKKWAPKQKTFDYLGLEVRINLWKDTGKMEVDGVNHSVI